MQTINTQYIPQRQQAGDFYFYVDEDASSVITVVKLYAAPSADSRYIKATEASLERYLQLYCGYSVALSEVFTREELKIVSAVAKKEIPVLASGMTAEEEAIVAAALADQLKRKAAGKVASPFRQELTSLASDSKSSSAKSAKDAGKELLETSRKLRRQRKNR